MPELEVILVQTYEPSGPFGAKAVAEIPKDGVAPALASAIHDATGVWIRQIPYTPEKVWLREVREESGYEVAVRKLVGVFDANRSQTPRRILPRLQVHLPL
jgi:8-oxo-dGTP pyrophosphatase MutT (NUDIX family)